MTRKPRWTNTRKRKRPKLTRIHAGPKLPPQHRIDVKALDKRTLNRSSTSNHHPINDSTTPSPDRQSTSALSPISHTTKRTKRTKQQQQQQQRPLRCGHHPRSRTTPANNEKENSQTESHHNNSSTTTLNEQSNKRHRQPHRRQHKRKRQRIQQNNPTVTQPRSKRTHKQPRKPIRA